LRVHGGNYAPEAGITSGLSAFIPSTCESPTVKRETPLQVRFRARGRPEPAACWGKVLTRSG
jgi:hypothetical protein